MTEIPEHLQKRVLQGYGYAGGGGAGSAGIGGAAGEPGQSGGGGFRPRPQPTPDWAQELIDTLRTTGQAIIALEARVAVLEASQTPPAPRTETFGSMFWRCFLRRA